MEPEVSLPHSQVPATCPCPEPDQSGPCLPLTSWRFILILSSHLHLGLPSGLFPSGFHTKTLYTPLLSPIRATCPVHLILLYLIAWAIFGEEYRSQSSSLCSFLNSPATSSLLGPNILLNTLFSNTLSLRSSLNVSDQVSHPCKTTGNALGSRSITQFTLYRHIPKKQRHPVTFPMNRTMKVGSLFQPTTCFLAFDMRCKYTVHRF